MRTPESTSPDAGASASQLFIVRIWPESSRSAAHLWRGSVEHIPSRQRFYFSSLGDLNDFISLRLKLESTPEGSTTADKRISD